MRIMNPFSVGYVYEGVNSIKLADMDPPHVVQLALVKWNVVIWHREHSAVNRGTEDRPYPAPSYGIPQIKRAFFFDILNTLVTDNFLTILPRPPTQPSHV